jgi:hypothetical protein
MSVNNDGAAMYRSRTITISIRRPQREVYDFLAEPLNLPTWGSTIGASIEHVSGNDWASESENGKLIYRYHPRNEYGILDHAVFREGEEPFTVPMRIAANGDDGAEVIYTLYQRPSMTEAEFDSEAEWVQADLLTLKSLLETR